MAKTRDILRRIRIESGLSQRDLADALGVSGPSIHHIEAGNNLTDYVRFLAWFRTCGYRLFYLPSGLSREDQTLVLRLGRVLQALPKSQRRLLQTQLEVWEADYNIPELWPEALDSGA